MGILLALALTACTTAPSQPDPSSSEAPAAASSIQQPAPDGTSTASGIVAPEPAASSTDASPAEPTASKVVVCLGDSIMEGKVPNYSEPDPWPTFLQEHLGEGWTLVNLGVTSTTVLEGESTTYRSTGNVEAAAACAPDVALIMLGTNDSWACSWDEEAFRAELASMVDQIKDASPSVRIVLMSPPRSFCEQDPSSVFDMDDALIGGPIRQAVERVARETGSDYLDIYRFTQDHPEWFPDTVHPNGEGNRAIAAYVYESAF